MAEQLHQQSDLQQGEAALLRADQILATLPEEYFPSDFTNSSTPQCRCHLRRTSQHLQPHQSYSPSIIHGSPSYSCSSLLSFADSTDASFSGDRRRHDQVVDEDWRRLRRVRQEETQLRNLLADLDERLLRLRQGAGSDQARLLLSLRRMSVERLLGAVASNADAKAKEAAASRGKQRQNGKGKTADGVSSWDNDSDSDLEASGDF